MGVNTKVEEWKKRLLDIGRTNKLINYKELRVGSVTIDTPNYKEIFNTLYTNGKSLEFIKKAEIDNLEQKCLEEILEEGQVLTKKNDSELKKSLDNLRLKAKSSLEEQGVNILYLGIGFLEWIDRENKETKSPILLFPVSIIQGNIFENSKLKLSGDEVVLNPALQLKFESEYNIILENPTEDDLLDIEKYFKYIEKVINNPMWKINTQVELGTFSFQKISMYKDFDELENEGLENKVVAAITGEKVEINSKEIINTLENNIDNINPNEVFQVLDADSSQQEAILAAKKGLSFVMQGPPGTGKSQTITNIIAECLSMGKSVLFVSEKLAALNVVYNRLKQVGLEEFCLQLHSNKSNKKDIIKELAETLSMPRHNEKANYTSTLNNLYSIREELNSYTKELHKIIKPFGKSLYEAYGILLEYSEAKDLTFNYDHLEDLTEDKLNEYNKLITSYSSLYNIVNKFDKKSIWKDYSLKVVNEAQIKHNIKSTISRLNRASNIIKEIKEKFNLSIKDNIEAFSELAKALEVIKKCDDFELQLASIDNLESHLKTLTIIKDKYNNIDELKLYIEEKYNSIVYDFDYLEIVTEAKTKNQEYINFVDKEKIKIKDKNELSKLSDDKIDFIINFAKNINETISLVNSSFDLNLSININELYSYTKLFKLIAIDFKTNEKLFDLSTITVVEKLIVGYKNKCKELDEYKNKLLTNFDKDLLEIDIKEILVKFRSEYSSAFKMFKPNYHKDVKQIKGFYKGNEKITEQLIIKSLELCKDIKELETTINDFKNKLSSYLDCETIDEYTDWNSIENSISTMKEINSELKKLGEEDNKAIKNIIISSDKSQKVSKIIEKVEVVLDNKITFNSFLELIYDEDNINNINSIIEPFKTLIKYKEYFNSVDTKLLEIIKNNEDISYEELKDDLSKVREIKKLENEVNQKEKLIPKIILNNGYSHENISKIIKSIDTGIIYKKNLDSVKASKLGLKALYNNKDFKSYVSSNIRDISEINIKLNKDITYINSLLNRNIDNFIKLDNSSGINWLNKQLDSVSNIRVYMDYYKVKESIDKFGVTSINIDQLILSNSIDELVKAINKRFISLWINYQSNKINSVRNFDKGIYEFKVKNFKVIDKEQFIIAKERLRHKLSIERPKGNIFGKKDNEVAILLHEANKKRMHLPIRKLFTTIPNLIFKIKPCFLMSPLAVSSFLDINKVKFDLVIFDEASQICPEDALGSMLRSKQVIVVGDSEQLPPTSFFSTSTVSEDIDSEDSIELHESILDKCSSIMPTVNLKWHYRSKHEDLISFSNKNIYKNLITIPSSKQRTKDFGVEFIKVDDAYYERSGSRVNRKEANVVARLVFNHFSRTPDKSLGIVTFSESQSVAIETAVRKLRELNPKFEEMFSEERKEPFFIKNIESVQGDERDVIIFSIGYGKDINGNMSMNFGPLSRSGGYRRLNVAITRAKYNVKVVSSIDPSDIDLSRTKSEGVRMLKSYMEFAKSGQLYERDEDVTTELNSILEKSIYNLLINNGYKVDTYVGTSEYKINFAVKSPINEYKYILAIELDGYDYNNNSIARERYRLREELLYSMGWNFYRIWPTEWVRNRKKVENELLNYLEDIISIEREKLSKEELLKDNNKLVDVIDVDSVVDVDNESIFEVDKESIIEEVYNEVNKREESIEEIYEVTEEIEVLSKGSNEAVEESSIVDYDTVNYEKDLVNESNIEDFIKNTYISTELNENLTEGFKLTKSAIDDENIGMNSILERTLDDHSKLEEVNNDYILIEENIPEKKIVEENKPVNIAEEEEESLIGINFENINLEDLTYEDITSKKINIIEQIVEKESPVHINRICEILLPIDKLQSITNKYKKNILNFIKINRPNVEIRDSEFLWKKGSEKVVLRNEIGYARKIQQISKEEIALAMIKSLQIKSKTKEELFKDVLNFFGDYSNEKSNQRYLIEAIDLLFEEDKIVLKKGVIKLKDNIKEEVKYVVTNQEKADVDLRVESIFAEKKFNSFVTFCKKNLIEEVTNITYDNIKKFQWLNLINREILNEIVRRVEKYNNIND